MWWKERRRWRRSARARIDSFGVDGEEDTAGMMPLFDLLHELPNGGEDRWSVVVTESRSSGAI